MKNTFACFLFLLIFCNINLFAEASDHDGLNWPAPKLFAIKTGSISQWGDGIVFQPLGLELNIYLHRNLYLELDGQAFKYALNKYYQSSIAYQDQQATEIVDFTYIYLPVTVSLMNYFPTSSNFSSFLGVGFGFFPSFRGSDEYLILNNGQRVEITPTEEMREGWGYKILGIQLGGKLSIGGNFKINFLKGGLFLSYYSLTSDFRQAISPLPNSFFIYGVKIYL